MHVNAQADLDAATGGVETETPGLKGAESPEPDGPTINGNNEFRLPSARQLSIRRSKRSRRKKVLVSSDDTNVEVVVEGGEGDAHEEEPSNDDVSKDKVEEKEDNEDEVLQLQERLTIRRCVSGVSWGGVEDPYVHT